jgi:hypothetical protein
MTCALRADRKSILSEREKKRKKRTAANHEKPKRVQRLFLPEGQGRGPGNRRACLGSILFKIGFSVQVWPGVHWL